MKTKKHKLTIVGLGYVGLPLALEFAKYFKVIGFDINKKRIKELLKYYDSNKEISSSSLKKIKNIKFVNKLDENEDSNIFIITAPTPIYKNNMPNLNILKKATKYISKFIKKDNIVIYESTVYPGTTEEICVPILEKNSKLIYNKDFFCGYSPERINPGDKKRKISTIKKVTSGSNKRTANIVNQLYLKIISAGTHLVPNIKTAEAAKIIENCQRDINIAFINELAIIFDKLNINLNDVLNAASTKWNFLNFKPGLVGGHCIGVDPYYLAYKSKIEGYDTKIISSGRAINDGFSKFLFNKVIRLTKSNFKKVNQSLNFLILGMTFKENCVDFRNSQSVVLFNLFKEKNIKVDAFDPMIDPKSFYNEFKIKLINKLKPNKYHCIILTVSHNIFRNLGENSIKESLIQNGIFFDLKNIFPNNNKNYYL